VQGHDWDPGRHQGAASSGVRTAGEHRQRAAAGEQCRTWWWTLHEPGSA